MEVTCEGEDLEQEVERREDQGRAVRCGRGVQEPCRPGVRRDDLARQAIRECDVTEEMEDGQMGQKQAMYFAGIPVPPDVELLLDKVDVSEGNRIPYLEIERMLGVRRDSHRWGTVVSGWRKRLEAERVVQLICDRGKAFVVANDSERVVVSNSHMSRSVNSARRALEIALRTPVSKLDASDRIKRKHLVRLATKIALLEAREGARLRRKLASANGRKGLPPAGGGKK